MKVFYSFLPLLFFFSSACGKEKIYTASTPANSIVRNFIGIPLTDSVDFIRWKLTLSENEYKLDCNYGIGKANTKGFINGGSKIQFKGKWQMDRNIYQFTNGSKTLKAVELNNDLLHLLNENNNFMTGNAGWSYTLNSISPVGTNLSRLAVSPAVQRDSMAYEGRTPCQVPGVVPPGMECYKLKWSIVFYENSSGNEMGRFYKVVVTPWRQEGGRKGAWKIIKGQNGSTMYQLNDEKGSAALFLLKLDDNVLVFTDAQGKLLVGNEDFSYTLNASK